MASASAASSSNKSILNIQLLDEKKMRSYISHYANELKGDRKTSFENEVKNLCFIDQFIEVYNDKQKDKQKKKESGPIYKKEKLLKNEDIDLAYVYSCSKSYTTGVAESLSDNPQVTKQSSFIVFFVLKNKDKEITNIFSATSGNAWQLVRSCNNIEFPIKIIKGVGSIDNIKMISRQSLFENATKETLFLPQHNDLYSTSSLYYLVESVTCEMHEESGQKFLESLGRNVIIDVSNELPHSSKEKQSSDSKYSEPPNKKRKIKYPHITITTAGSLKIEKKIEVQDYFVILKYLEEYLRPSTSQSNNSKFEFLYFLKVPEKDKSVLDDELIKHIFRRYEEKQNPTATVRHKYFKEFFLSNKFEIEISRKSNDYKCIGSEPPTIRNIIDILKAGTSDHDLDKLKDQMKNRRLRFDLNIEPKPIIDCIEGEIFLDELNYFKVRSMWYQMSVDYLSLLQRDFEKLMDETFINGIEEGSLPIPWKKDIPLDQTELQKCLKYKESDMKGLMDKLRGMKVSYISNNEVKQQKLIGAILRAPNIKKYRSEIELALGHSRTFFKKNWCSFLQEKIKESNANLKNNNKDLNTELDEIWKELNKKRPVLTLKNKKSFIVQNPFPYQLKNEDKYKKNYEKIVKFLTDASVHQIEGDYNRSYLDIPSNLRGHNYLVFDQICPDGIEPCDILSYTDNVLYLYHVKEKFGPDTRVVCSQILNSATRIQEALRTNQEDHYLKRLWQKAMELPKNKNELEWRKKVKGILLRNFGILKVNQIEESSIDNENEDSTANYDEGNAERFVDLFRYRDIVFVYAYRTLTGFKKCVPCEPISNAINGLCRRLGFVNESGALTTKFVNTSKRKFSSQLLSQNNRIQKEEYNNAYDILVSKYIKEKCKNFGFLNKFGALTTKFLFTTADKFESELFSDTECIAKTEYKKVYSEMHKRVFSDSSLAKMEVIRLAEKLRTFQNRFKFKICEVPIHETLEPEPSTSQQV